MGNQEATQVAEATEAEKHQAANRKAATDELDAMHRAFDALHKLDYGARCRALRWLESRLDNSYEAYKNEPPF